MAIPTSASYNKIIKGNGRKFHAGAHVVLVSGTTLDLDDRNIMTSSGIEIEDAVSESDEFQIGAAIINEITLKLNNFEGIFNDYDFKGAVITPWVGLTTAAHWRDGEIIEKIPKGVFTAEKSPAKNSVISLVADDNMAKFDVVYSKSTLKYPATLGAIAADVCSVCGVTLATTIFPNSTYSVASRPSETSITCREILSYVAQLAGCFARCNSSGAVEIKWYTEPATLFDVGKYVTSYDVATSDTEITGVQIQGNDDSKTVYTSGTNDYAIRIKSNPLAQDGLQALANTLGTKFIGIKFRSYSVLSPSNPAIEAGDIVNMTDKSGITHKTFVSRLSYEFGEAEEFNADAETVTENQSERFTAAEKAQETANTAQAIANEAESEVELVSETVGGIEVRVTATEEGLESKVSKDEISSEIQQHPTDVVFAFNNLSGTQSLKFDGTGFDVYDGSTKIAHIGVLKSEESGTTVKTYTAIQSVDDSAGIALRPNNGKGLYLLNTNSNDSGYDLMHMGYAFFEKGVASHGLISTNGNMNCDTLTCKTLTAEHGGGGGSYVTAGQKAGTTLGKKATAEGEGTTASGYYSHAEGYSTTASGYYSHAEGEGTTASGNNSHAEGYDTTTSGVSSHAEGEGTTASGYYSHAEGRNAVASSHYSHAEGNGTKALGIISHAEGSCTTASGRSSHSEGERTTAHDFVEHTGGAFNKVSTGSSNSYSATNNAFVIGNGVGGVLSNCFRIDFSGNVYGCAAFNASGADYAEYFEWADGNPNKEDRAGRFVALKGSKIRFAKPNDDVLGIVSGNPTVIGDAASESWNGRYARDIFGRVILETVNVPAEYSKDGKVTHEAHTELRQKANSDYDASKEADYISREKRPEWSAIGMHGKLVMLDDGTCKADGYCKPADSGTGIATATKGRNNYRVMERLDKTHIRVCLK